MLQIDEEKQWKEDEERDSIEMHRKITHLQLDLTRWIRTQRRVVEFLKTKSAPFKHTEETEALIEAAKEALEELIGKKRKETQLQVERLNQEFKEKRKDENKLKKIARKNLSKRYHQRRLLHLKKIVSRRRQPRKILPRQRSQKNPYQRRLLHPK